MAGAKDRTAFDRAPPGDGFDAWRRVVVPIGPRSEERLHEMHQSVTRPPRSHRLSDIEADLTLKGQIRSADSICGEVIGQLIKPTEFDLEGTTVGMAAVSGDDYSAVEPSLTCAACAE